MHNHRIWSAPSWSGWLLPGPSTILRCGSSSADRPAQADPPGLARSQICVHLGVTVAVAEKPRGRLSAWTRHDGLWAIYGVAVEVNFRVRASRPHFSQAQLIERQHRYESLSLGLHQT